MGLTASEIETLVDDMFPQARKLGWALESVGDCRARMTLPVQEQHLRPGPSVSGPTLMAFADTAMYFAVLGEIGRQPLAVTTNLNMHFMRRFGEGTLVAEAEVIKNGKRLMVGHVSIAPAEGGPPVAFATVTYSVPPNKAPEDLGAKVRQEGVATKEHFQRAYADNVPPWDIGRPQRDLVTTFDALAPTGSAIDLGCGTGEHVLELAQRGVDAWGIDSTAMAAVQASKKASERSLEARFVVGDALDLVGLGRQFDLVLDCGLFHVINHEERLRYVEQVRRALPTGGRHVMLGFSTNPEDRGPRGYSMDELRTYFADGFEEETLREAIYEANNRADGQPAILSVFTRR